MITDIPTPEEFFISGWRFLDYAWSQAMDLIIDIQTEEGYRIDLIRDRERYQHQYDKDNSRDIREDIQECWEIGRPKLITSLALVQQGIELLLKGCIAEVSPYLLISEPRNYPNKCDKENTSFSEFRTIDAHDLIKVYDTVREIKLSKDFKKRFDELRQHRNKAFHSVSKSMKIEASEVLIAVFETVENLNSGKRWLKIHKNFLENSHISPFVCLESVARSRMMIEMEVIIEQLTPEKIERYTGIITKENFYKCPLCTHTSQKYGGTPRFAQMVLDKSRSTKFLYCFCCCENLEAVENLEVIEASCQASDCDSTFLDTCGVCLACGHENELKD